MELKRVQRLLLYFGKDISFSFQLFVQETAMLLNTYSLIYTLVFESCLGFIERNTACLSFQKYKKVRTAMMAGQFHLVQYLILDSYQPQLFKVQEFSFIQLSPCLGLFLSDFYNHIYPSPAESQIVPCATAPKQDTAGQIVSKKCF